jgi:hypothetical protein
MPIVPCCSFEDPSVHALLETMFYFNTLYIEVNKKIRPCEEAAREQPCLWKRYRSMGALFAHIVP